MASNCNLAWAAGFFDGEGCTSVLKARRDSYSYIRMNIAQKNLECLEKFKSIVLLGKIYKSKTRNIYSWDCYKQEDVSKVLESLWPYLSEVKKIQAIKAQEKRDNNKKEICGI